LSICRVVNEKPVHLRRRRLKRWLKRAFIIAAAPAVLFFTVFHIAVAVWPYPAGIERQAADATYISDIQGRPLAELAAPDDQWRLTLLESEISPHLLSAILAAEGQAEARLRVASAEAQAIQMVAQAIGAAGNPAQYLIAQRYLESLSSIATGANKLVFLPFEASGIMASLGGIKELLNAQTPAVK